MKSSRDLILRISALTLMTSWFVFSSSIARATLGGNEASVGSGLHGQHVKHAKTAADYTVHDITTGSQTVKEYVNSQGVVFAVTWSGNLQPDLSKLFGSYYSEYQAQSAKAIRRRGARRQDLKTANLSIQKWGHMRSMHGRAILNSALPASVKPGDLK